MKKEKRSRATDPLWILVCRLWDALEPEDHKTIVQAMELLAAKQRQQNEGPDDANTPVESKA